MLSGRLGLATFSVVSSSYIALNSWRIDVANPPLATASVSVRPVAVCLVVDYTTVPG